MEVDGPASSEIGQLGQSELDNQGRSGLGMSEFDLSSPLNYGTPSSNNPLASQGKLPLRPVTRIALKNGNEFSVVS